jgi:flagellar basal-body rod protein FlgF
VNVSLYQAAAAMSANARWQEVISENLASTNVPGFKKQDLTFEAVQAGLMQQPNLDPSMHFTLPRATTATSFAPGELKSTGVDTDVAIEGKGFFEVELPTGGKAYTRDGEFHLNSLGQLTTKSGNLVMGESGPIQFDRNMPGAITISPTGEVSQGDTVRGKLKITDFDQPQLLTQASGGLFLTNNNPNLNPKAVTSPSLRQGYLEGSNASSVTEMANLIGVMRSFEANQKLVQLQDERMGRVITELGNPS